jgi:N6-adenosine-specific RNA methylase IME4
MSDPFANLPRGHYGAILADPPWHFQTWGEGSKRNVTSKYSTMQAADIAALPVAELAAPDCVLFMWIVWPKLFEAVEVIERMGFHLQNCAFAWLKADAFQVEMFPRRCRSENGNGLLDVPIAKFALLGTRGKPKRLNAGVRQGIIEPRREHSRKPDCVHDRIQRSCCWPLP